MINKPTQKEWGLKLLIYKEVVETFDRYFTKLSVPYMPINGAYFCHTDLCEKLPPCRLFDIEFIVDDKNYSSIINYLCSLDNCLKENEFEHKTIFAYQLEKHFIRVDVYKSINCLSVPNLTFNQFSIRGVKKCDSSIVLPSIEDAFLLILWKAFHFVDQFIDSELYVQLDILSSQPEFLWENILANVRDYGLYKFLVYIHLLPNNKNQRLNTLLAKKKSHYLQFLSNKKVQKILYYSSPRIVRKLFVKIPLVNNPPGYFVEKVWHTLKGKFFQTLYLLKGRIVLAIAHSFIARNERINFENITRVSLNRPELFTFDQAFSESFIIGTTSGLWVLKDTTCRKISCGASYGITRTGKKWFACQYTGIFSQIVSFELDKYSRIPQIKYEKTGMPGGIHQIDLYADELFAVDTQNNSIIQLLKNGKRKIYYPNKKIKKSGNNNNHFNSVFITNNYMYVLAHNGMLNLNKCSEIYVLEKPSLKCKEIIKLPAYSAHNVLLFKGKFIYCNSLAGELIWGDKVFYKNERFYMRGLSITDKSIVVGGSQFAKRDRRPSTDCTIWFLDYTGKLKREITLKKSGQIYEIRAFDKDYGLSEFTRKLSEKNNAHTEYY